METRKDFKWTVYAVSSVALLLVFIATYLCVRLTDGMWDSMSLPMIFIIIYGTVEFIALMFIGLSYGKCEQCKGCSEPQPVVVPVPEPVVVAPVKTRKPRTPKAVVAENNQENN